MLTDSVPTMPSISKFVDPSAVVDRLSGPNRSVTVLCLSDHKLGTARYIKAGVVGSACCFLEHIVDERFFLQVLNVPATTDGKFLLLLPPGLIDTSLSQKFAMCKPPSSMLLLIHYPCSGRFNLYTYFYLS